MTSVESLPKTCEQREGIGDRATKFGRFMLTQIIGCEEKFHTFRNVAELRTYVKKIGKYFVIYSTKKAAILF